MYFLITPLPLPPSVSQIFAMDNGDPPAHTTRHIPIDICENIIDHLYSGYDFSEQIGNVRALHCCALVCRDRRIRSQMRLFHSVILHDVAAVHRFSAALESGPHLSDYVYEVMLVGRTLQTTANPLCNFPVALHGKLPRLQTFLVRHIDDCADWYPNSSRPATGRRLQYLPLHPRFPLFFSSLTTITTLSIRNVIFRHFSDLVRMVNTLPRLQVLLCTQVWCATLGPLPESMKVLSNASGAPEPRPALDTLFLVGTLSRRCSTYITS